MKKVCLASVLLMSFCSIVLTQKDSTRNYMERPFQFTFITPIGTNGVMSSKIVNNFSVNLLVGYSAGVDGLEVGAFLNMNKAYMYGAQFAGFGNINGGDVNGVQLSGFSNINGGTVEGFQAAGFSNINGNSKDLVQFAGFLNATGDIEGVQGAGFMNIARNVDAIQAAGFMNLASKVDGVQVSGFLNAAEEVDGVQAAGFINKAENVDGVQIAGFVNLAKNVDGVQLAGFINICDSINGIPLAVISVVRKNGYRKLKVWSNETFYINTSYNIGIKEFYSILTLGLRPGRGDYNWAVGGGFGTNITIDHKKSIDLEGIHYHIVKNRFWDPDYNYNYQYNSLNQFNVSFTYHVNDKSSIFAGPSFNILTGRAYDITRELTPNWAYELWNRNHDVKFWFGFNAGLKF